MRPFKETLRLNVAAARLAPTLYYAKLQAFGEPERHWEALDMPTRHSYTERAAEFLKTLDPKPVSVSFVTGLGKKVIGVIGNGAA